MDTRELRPGMVFPSYKALCEKIGEQPKIDKARRVSHFNMLKKYFDFDFINESGRKILIVDVHTRDKFENILTCRGTYGNDITLTIINRLMKQPDKTECFTKESLLQLFGFPSYKELVDCMQVQLSDEQETIVRHVYYKLFSYVFNKIEMGLKSMVKKEYIAYSPQIKVYSSKKAKYQIASQLLQEQIAETEKETLKELNERNLWMVYIHKKNNRFFKIMNQKLEQQYGIVNYVKVKKLELSCLIDNEKLPRFSDYVVRESARELRQLLKDGLPKEIVTFSWAGVASSQQEALKNQVLEMFFSL